jgi:quinol monooxygenase YgiN
MLIRIVTTRADVPRTGEGIAFVHGEIQPKVAAMDGNAGFAMAVDRSSGRYVGIGAWTDPEALEASGQSAPALIADLVRRLHGTEPSVEVFDLVLAHLVKPVRLGYRGRLTRLEVPAHDLDRAAQTFQQWVLALFDRYDGLAAIILFVDRTGGVLECITWYDSLRVLRGSASRTRELRDLLVADVPTMRFVEEFELEAVITEMDELSRHARPTYTWN